MWPWQDLELTTCEQLENWTRYRKLVFSDVRKQCRTDLERRGTNGLCGCAGIPPVGAVWAVVVWGGIQAVVALSWWNRDWNWGGRGGRSLWVRVQKGGSCAEEVLQTSGEGSPWSWSCVCTGWTEAGGGEHGAAGQPQNQSGEALTNGRLMQRSRNPGRALL